MAEALYRKYRPIRFADVAEQQHVVRTITNQLAGGKVAHAYLFSGPRGVGKTTIARLLAKALNCEQRQPGQAEPCNQCSSCKDALVGRFLDVVEIDAASQTKVEETRENIIESVRFAPTRGKYKVFIIDEVHMLSTSSFNALLKTLEEPPAHALFILATTELHKIPATIISRCQRFDFHRIPAKDIIRRLQGISQAEGVKVDDDVLASIARLSEGCLRDAESLLGQVLAIGEKHVSATEAGLVIPATHLATVVALTEKLVVKDTKAAIAVVESFVEEGGSVRHLLDELLEFVRTLLFTVLGAGDQETYDEATLEKIQQFAAQTSAQDMKRLLDLLLSSRGRSTPTTLPQLPLEIALVEYAVGEENHRQIPATPVTPKAVTQPAAPVALKTVIPEIPPEAQVIAPTNPESSQSNLSEADVQDIKDKWGRCVTYIGEKNMALPLILNTAEVLRSENGRLLIGFPYVMHVEKMNQRKNSLLVEEAIKNITLKDVTVAFVQTKSKEDESVSTLLEAFGGSVM